mgnify:CR=1 FL=1
MAVPSPVNKVVRDFGYGNARTANELLSAASGRLYGRLEDACTKRALWDATEALATATNHLDDAAMAWAKLIDRGVDTGAELLSEPIRRQHCALADYLDVIADAEDDDRLRARARAFRDDVQSYVDAWVGALEVAIKPARTVPVH